MKHINVIGDRERGIKEAIKVLKSGGLVVYPTETVYGIGADASNPDAVQKLTTYKKLRKDKPYSVMVANTAMAKKYAYLNDIAKNLYKKYLPGPYTIISKGKHKFASGVESTDGTIGIRMSSHDIPHTLAKEFGRPFTAASANASYKKKPRNIFDITDNISKKQEELIDLVLDYGQLPDRRPSTIIDTTLDDVSISRIGDEEIRFQNRQMTYSPEETRAIGEAFINDNIKYLDKRTLIFALQGDMGSGKTVMTQGMGKVLGIDEIVSPSYTLSLEYPFTAQEMSGYLFHIDTWRMFDSTELLELGFESMVKPGNIIVVEWAAKFVDIISGFGHRSRIIWVKLDSIDLETRSITF